VADGIEPGAEEVERLVDIVKNAPLNEIDADLTETLATGVGNILSTKRFQHAVQGGPTVEHKVFQMTLTDVIGNVQMRQGPAAEERRRAMAEDPLIPAPDHVCPRCMGDVPVPGKKGEYEGARSRTDNVTEVCSRCGGFEAQEEAADTLTPQSGWPVADIVVPRGRSGTTYEESRGIKGSVMMPYPGPKEIPDFRLHLLDRWQAGGPFERMVEMLTDRNTTAAQWAASKRATLQTASLWWIKEDMVRITESAARSMPDDVKGYEVKLPASQKRGLVVFEQPWLGMDAVGAYSDKVRVHALTWAAVSIEGIPCLSITMYEYFDFGAGMGKRDVEMAVVTGVIYEGMPEPTGSGAHRLRGGAWVLLGRTDWPIKEKINEFTVFDTIPSLSELVEGDARRASMVEDRKFLAAFCTLVNHKLSNVDQENVPRYVRRRAARAGHPMTEPSTVRLVRLRETRHHSDVDPDAEAKHVEWSHRWMVDGHWAWRACGPKSSQRRLVFVVPYVKGPSDKPLVIKEKVRTWVR
jgi:hypothetical protein